MTSILSPLLELEAVKLSKGPGLFRKQILPKGKFNYKGEVIDFDKIGQDVKAAFDAKALDQVAFQLADSGNNHNFDPTRYRGEVKAIELTEDGVYGTFDFSQFPDMQELVTKNPRFGVSAQIERNLKTGDGKEFPHAFSHVLGTLNPRVTGMKPWEKISLSKEIDWNEVLDLSATEVKGAVTQKTEDKKTEEGVMLSKEEYEKFQGFLKTLDEVEKLEFSKPSGEGEPADDATSKAIQLANERAENALKLAREAELKFAKSDWAQRSSQLVHDGVPPAMLELAKPLMERPDTDVTPIQLSNSESLDPKAIVLSVLEAAKGTIDLSAPKGHEFDGSEKSDDDDPAFKAFRDSFFADQF